MFSAHDRYSLALGVLKADAETNLILADLLDEEGDRAMAERARSLKKSHKRLDFVVDVLPYRTSLRLACDCFAHALQNFQESESLIEGISQVGAWARGEADEETLEWGCLTVSRVGPWKFQIKDIDQTAQTLHAAAKSAATAEHLKTTNEAGKFRAVASEARSSSRKVIRASREMVKPNSWQTWDRDDIRRPNSVTEPTVELAWQLEHVEYLIQEMLERPE